MARGHFHVDRANAAISTVVIPIVPVTAMPYAAARFDEVWNPSTSEIEPIISSQFTTGT